MQVDPLNTYFLTTRSKFWGLQVLYNHKLYVDKKLSDKPQSILKSQGLTIALNLSKKQKKIKQILKQKIPVFEIFHI